MRLRNAIDIYESASGETMTYARLADEVGVSESMIRKLGSEIDYHPTLEHLDVLCEVLGVELTDLLERVPGVAPRKRAMTDPRRRKAGVSKRSKK